MSKPTDDIHWATDANYPAGPSYGGTPTKSEPSTGRKDEGWDPGQKPPAQWMSWWMNAVARYIAWLAAVTDPKWHWIHAGTAVVIANATPAFGSDAGLFGASGSNTAVLPLVLPVGTRITQVGIRLRHGTSESAGVVADLQLIRSCGAIQGTANLEEIPSDPPQATHPTFAIDVDNGADHAWETKTVNLSSAGDINVVQDGYSYAFLLSFSGTIIVESVGYESAPT